MYLFTWGLVISVAILTGVTVLMIGEIAHLRTNLKETLEKNEMLWQLAENLNRKQVKIAAIGRHPSTGEIGEKIMKIISETNLTSPSQDR